LLVISGCGGTSKEGAEKKAPEYAATPRKSLESWVTAVRAGDTEMMCRLLFPRGGCVGGKELYTTTGFLRHVRAEIRGLTGDLRYGAIGIGGPEGVVVIGVVSSDSPVAYAVPVVRGKIQWSISPEAYSPSYARRSSSTIPIRRPFWRADARPSPSPPGPTRPDRCTRTQNFGSTVGTSTGASLRGRIGVSPWNEAAGSELRASSLAGM
jgi:hypothetical protein